MLTTQQIAQQIEAEGNAQTVSYIAGQPVTRGELSAAFRLVADKTNWKLPVNAEIVADFDTIDRVREAIVFFAGCRAKIEVIEPVKSRTDGKAKYRVTAPGYYNAVGA